jgi:magnesium transporter
MSLDRPSDSSPGDASPLASGFGEKIGQPPGSVVYTGEDPDRPVTFSVIDYDRASLSETQTRSVEDVLAYASTETVSWIDVTGLHDEEAIRTIGDHFGIHPLVQEDIANTDQRPKVEVQDGHLYATIKMLYVSGGEAAGGPPGDAASEPQLRSDHVSLVVGPNYLISFTEQPDDVFEPVRQRLRAGTGRIRGRGADYLAYALLDVIVDHYFLVVESVSEWAEDLEDEILEGPADDTQDRINALRRDLIFMRRTAWPARELLLQLTRTESPLWDEETHPFVRDTYDHALQVIDHVDALRDTVSGLMDLHMSALSHRMNEIMKVLTIIGTIFIPLTFVAGIYGMNFEYMPELSWRYGYFVSLGVMGAITLVSLEYFRRKGWL